MMCGYGEPNFLYAYYGKCSVCDCNVYADCDEIDVNYKTINGSNFEVDMVKCSRCYNLVNLIYVGNGEEIDVE